MQSERRRAALILSHFSHTYVYSTDYTARATMLLLSALLPALQLASLHPATDPRIHVVGRTAPNGTALFFDWCSLHARAAPFERASNFTTSNTHHGKSRRMYRRCMQRLCMHAASQHCRHAHCSTLAPSGRPAPPCRTPRSAADARMWLGAWAGARRTSSSRPRVPRRRARNI
jgi:hypothetical protein